MVSHTQNPLVLPGLKCWSVYQAFKKDYLVGESAIIETTVDTIYLSVKELWFTPAVPSLSLCRLPKMLTNWSLVPLTTAAHELRSNINQNNKMRSDH